MPLLFSLTLFCSALLLFQVQPMVGKMLLPKLGGTPAVWNACMVFFQAALLAGYAYAHASTRLLGSRRQLMLHLAILPLPMFVLPIAISDEAFRSGAASDFPALLVLTQLTLAVGLPFFVVSTTAPLLQRWFADTGHASAKDPYFLYAASNLGSMIALVAYPLLVEPLLPLGGQGRVWTIAYCGYVALVVMCGAALWMRAPVVTPTVTSIAPSSPSPSWSRRLRWLALSFVPSSMLLGTTTYISTDIAPIPLLWVIPLALYLLTFIFVFAKKPPLPHAATNRALPISILILSLLLSTGATELRGVPVVVLLGIHLLAFFLTAMVAHGELAKDRPPAEHLTEFFLLMSVGGVMGGVFNAIVAPVLFQKTGLTEYPLILVLACMIRPATSTKENQATSGRLADLGQPLAVAALTFGMMKLAGIVGLPIGPVRTGLTFGLPALLVFTFADRPLRFGLGIAVLLTAGAASTTGERLMLERNFFGVVKVADIKSPDGETFRTLFHGNTIHGQMSLDKVDSDGRHEPQNYFHPESPVGFACGQWFRNRPAGQNVGIVGLGTGSLAYYARAGDRWTYYEIDPAIQRVAEDERYFRFFAECRAGKPSVLLGDAYLRMQEAADHSYDLLILDAFSSDSIPVHLLTREAFELYRQKLKPGGAIFFHISNRYLNLRPILAKLAHNSELIARSWYDRSNGPRTSGKFDSEWVIMAANEVDFGDVVTAGGDRWKLIQPHRDTPLWTNDYSNILSAFGRDRE